MGGEPIKVGTHFGDYHTWTMAITRHYEEQGEVDPRIANLPSPRSVVQMNQGYYNRMQGFCLGERAELYVDWNNGTETLYTNEYKPTYKRPIPRQDVYNQAFTTIYDWGYDSQNQCRYYYKAEDKNGNGVVDEGEIIILKNFLIKDFNQGGLCPS